MFLHQEHQRHQVQHQQGLAAHQQLRREAAEGGGREAQDAQRGDLGNQFVETPEQQPQLLQGAEVARIEKVEQGQGHAGEGHQGKLFLGVSTLAEENLRNQTRRYEVGMVTTTDLLKFQNEVTNARLNENQALIDYNDSLTELERAQGTLLRRYNVDVEPRQPTKTPWWALF